MTDATTDAAPEPKKRGKLPFILGLVAALGGAGAGFYAAFSGLLPGTAGAPEYTAKDTLPGALPDVTYVEVEPLTVSLNPASQGRHLRFRAQLEVPSPYASDVESLLPRVVDVLNGYLRAVETRDIESPSALLRLRSQMLRRVQIVTGPDRVNDLLVMEFVLN